MSGLDLSPSAGRFLVGLDHESVQDAIYDFLLDLMKRPIGGWAAEPGARKEVFRGYRILFRLEVDDLGVDFLKVEEIASIDSPEVG